MCEMCAIAKSRDVQRKNCPARLTTKITPDNGRAPAWGPIFLSVKTEIDFETIITKNS